MVELPIASTGFRTSSLTPEVKCACKDLVTVYVHYCTLIIIAYVDTSDRFGLLL